MKAWKKAAVLGGLSLGVSSLLYAHQRAALDLNILPVDIGVLDLPPEFEGYQIAHISDLHLDGLTMTRDRLGAIVAAINDQQPDLIAFTGDFVTNGRGFRVSDLVEPLRQLRARDGVVAVMGNHDHRLNTGLIRRAIRDSGLIDLNNAVHVVQRGAASLYVAGVDSVLRQRARLDLVLPQIPEGSLAILLAHEPDFADVSAATGRFVLQLSGHSHGGQIRLPVLTRLALPAFAQRYVQGVEQVGPMALYVNRGLGTVGPPLRFNCPPEVTLINLTEAVRSNN